MNNLFKRFIKFKSKQAKNIIIIPVMKKDEQNNNVLLTKVSTIYFKREPYHVWKSACGSYYFDAGVKNKVFTAHSTNKYSANKEMLNYLERTCYGS